MRRLWCRWFGHDNIWTLDPMRPGEHIVTCLTCRDRAFSYFAKRDLAEEGRLLASQRDDLITQGVDPADLEVPRYSPTKDTP